MHNLQGQFDGFQFLIKDLNSTKDSIFFKAVAIESHIKGPKYLMEFDKSRLYLPVELKILIVILCVYYYYVARINLI